MTVVREKTKTLHLCAALKLKTKTGLIKETTSMTLAMKSAEEYDLPNEDQIADMDAREDEEEELFEINLEFVNNIPPPQYCWEGYFTTTTGNALLANCLLPIADVSSAIPMRSKACDNLNLSRSAAKAMWSFLLIAESKTGELLDFPSLHGLCGQK